MATGFQIGQLRYAGSGCVSNITGIVDYQGVAMGEGGTATSFQDLVIKPSTSFISGQDYYLSLKIPQDMNYDLSFNIKLEKDDLTNDYQFLKNVSIIRGGSGTNAYNVVLYELPNKDVRAMIPLQYVPNSQNVKDSLYYDSTSDIYYIGNGGTSYTKTADINAITMIASWKQDIGDNFGTFELIFRPVESGFSKIAISLVRDAIDYNIQRLDDNGNIEFGRKIDKDKVSFELLKINNLVDQINKEGSLSKIGVWSHSGMIMCINGEEIKVGPSGYYELDALPITSIGFVARDNDYRDNWTLDYEYKALSE